MEQSPQNRPRRTIPHGSGLVIGVGVGVALGAAFNKLGLGIAVGVALGLAFEQVNDHRSSSRQ